MDFKILCNSLYQVSSGLIITFCDYLPHNGIHSCEFSAMECFVMGIGPGVETTHNS